MLTMATRVNTSHFLISGFILLLGLFGYTAQSAGSQDQGSCNNPSVTEGQSSNLTFYFGRDIDTESDSFFAYLRRNSDPAIDILRCNRPDLVTPVMCKAIDTRFGDCSFTTNYMTVKIAKTVKGLEDTYTLQVYEKSSPQPPILCNLTITEDTQKEDKQTWIAAPVIVVILVVGLIAGSVVLYLRKRRNQRGTASTSEDDGNQDPLLLTETMRRYGNVKKRWFQARFTEEEEEKLLQSDRIQEGSFLITVGRTNPNQFLLIVFSDGVLKRFPIEPENEKLRVIDTGVSFKSLTKLVEYYRTHTIRDGDTGVGILSKPFRTEPDEDWYFGKFTRQDENKLLQTAEHKSGCFLIRQGITDPENYVLAVCVNGTMQHFTIVEVEEGFQMRDTGKISATLNKLVEFYKTNEINDGTPHGKLIEPFQKEQIECLSDNTNG